MKGVERVGKMTNGKHSVSILDRASQVYLPPESKLSQSPDHQRTKSSGQQSRPQSSQQSSDVSKLQLKEMEVKENLTGAMAPPENPFQVDGVSPEIINNLFLFPELFAPVQYEHSEKKSDVEDVIDVLESERMGSSIGGEDSLYSMNFEQADVAVAVAVAAEQQYEKKGGSDRDGSNNRRSELFTETLDFIV